MQPNPELVSSEMLVKVSENAVGVVRKSLAKALAVKKVGLRRVTPNLAWYELDSKRVKGLPPAAAFELAHDLLAIPEIQAIEPGFEPVTPLPFDADTKGTQAKLATSMGKHDVDPDTEGKYAWHLDQVRAKQARTDFGVTGNTIRVAHPDTGYTLHPELITGVAIRADLGYNFQEGVASPIEPIRTIDSGHGTATASVLIGLDGKQHNLPNIDAYVEGVAPGAELVPMRVDKNVWWMFAPKNDVKAIDRAIAKGCHVISMSRSGLDYEILREAVTRAISSGLIVVAAAGNCNLGCQVRSPAKYPEVVCAGGTTYSKRFWDSSSRGKEVTISAPAHSVYRAKASEAKKQYAYVVERSSGTSYATPTIAGAAALWLQHHGGTSEIATKVGGLSRVPIVFKHLLMTAGFQAGTDWDAQNNGVGILDCVALLSASLPTPNDVPAIEKAMRLAGAEIAATQLHSMKMLKGGMPAAVDGRAAKLLALEFEVAEFHEPAAAKVLTEGKPALLKMKQTNASAKVTPLRVSKQLYRTLETLSQKN